MAHGHTLMRWVWFVYTAERLGSRVFAMLIDGVFGDWYVVDYVRWRRADMEGPDWRDPPSPIQSFPIPFSAAPAPVVFTTSTLTPLFNVPFSPSSRAPTFPCPPASRFRFILPSSPSLII